MNSCDLQKGMEVEIKLYQSKVMNETYIYVV